MPTIICTFLEMSYFVSGYDIFVTETELHNYVLGCSVEFRNIHAHSRRISFLMLTSCSLWLFFASPVWGDLVFGHRLVGLVLI